MAENNYQINIATTRTKQALEEYMHKISPFAVREILANSKDEIYRQGLAEASRLASLSSVRNCPKAALCMSDHG